MILITGGCGFIGSAVVQKLILSGECVVNVDIMTYAAIRKSDQELENNKNYYFEKCDIRDTDNLAYIFEKYKPSIVLHLAAESHVDRSITNPSDFITTNILGTYNLLTTSLSYLSRHKSKANKFRFIHVSTDEVFGSLTLEDENKFTELTSYAPNSPYSASKASSDHLVRAWHETYGLQTIITNCSNNFGPRQNKEKLVPLAINQLLKGNKIPIYGTGKNIRDWIYVEDHVDALLAVLKGGSIGETYNIGADNEISNLNLIAKLCAIFEQIFPQKKYPVEHQIEFVSDRSGHDVRYAINSNKIIAELDWYPTNTFDEALIKTVDWYIKDYKDSGII